MNLEEDDDEEDGVGIELEEGLLKCATAGLITEPEKRLMIELERDETAPPD